MATKKHSSKDVYSCNYYYAQVFTDSKSGKDEFTKPIHFVIFANTKFEAITKGNLYLKENTPEDVIVKRKINLYHKNYKRDSKMLIEQNKYVD